MLKGLFPSDAPFPTNKEEGVAYTEFLADGIKFWIKIDMVAVPLTILLWVTGIIPVIIVGFVALFAVGCPIIMTLGFSIGCIQHLTVQECYAIVKRRLMTA